jgi:SAM-dependent methyltransferase
MPIAVASLHAATEESKEYRRYYDAPHNRLVYVGESATPEMWDSRWAPTEAAVREAVRNEKGTRWVVNLTRRFLPQRGARILEGGCGLGYNVAALHRAGYRVSGIDFAPETVSMIGRVAPELGVFLADVSALPFADAAFDGYWSLGVIEHCYRGYQPLAEEMRRVIKPGGFLFLTFPCMSPLRRLLATLRHYEPLSSEEEPPGFYQFALDPVRVVSDFVSLGFTSRYERGMSGLLGIKDELIWAGAPLRALSGYNGRQFAIRALRGAIERIGPAFGTAHSVVFVLQKTS